ncbi:MAG: hypothetical protein AAFP90_02885 [Planctomycetota bacterium]
MDPGPPAADGGASSTIRPASPAASPNPQSKEKLAESRSNASTSVAASADAASDHANASSNGKQNVAAPIPVGVWNDDGARKCLNAALARMDSLFLDAQSIHAVKAIESGTMRVIFRGDAAMSRARAERPEMKAKLDQAIQAAAGRRIVLEFDTDASTTPVRKEIGDGKQKASNRIQRMKEIDRHPLVDKCRELFDVEIIKVDNLG